MNKKELDVFLYGVLIGGALWLLISFFNWELDIAKWSSFSRVAFVFLSLISGAFVIESKMGGEE